MYDAWLTTMDLALDSDRPGMNLEDSVTQVKPQQMSGGPEDARTGWLMWPKLPLVRVETWCLSVRDRQGPLGADGQAGIGSIVPKWHDGRAYGGVHYKIVILNFLTTEPKYRRQVSTSEARPEERITGVR